MLALLASQASNGNGGGNSSGPIVAIAPTGNCVGRRCVQCDFRNTEFPVRWIRAICALASSVREQAAAANRLRNLLSRQQNSSASFLCLLRRNVDNQQPSEKFH